MRLWTSVCESRIHFATWRTTDVLCKDRISLLKDLALRNKIRTNTMGMDLELGC
jgi:hypothetical protein